VTTKINTFCVVIPCSLVDSYQSFRGTYCVQLSTLKKGAASFYRTLVRIQPNIVIQISKIHCLPEPFWTHEVLRVQPLATLFFCSLTYPYPSLGQYVTCHLIGFILSCILFLPLLLLSSGFLPCHWRWSGLVALDSGEDICMQGMGHKTGPRTATFNDLLC
jgi:hypothetical protein